MRTLAWCQERERKEHAKSAVCWGDRERKILFRRYLLNPGLLSFGASRGNDTCAFWSAGGRVPDGETAGGEKPQSDRTSLRDAQHKQHELEASFPDVVCYPPPGYYPCELLQGTVPTWTIMPNCQRYQKHELMTVLGSVGWITSAVQHFKALEQDLPAEFTVAELANSCETTLISKLRTMSRI